MILPGEDTSPDTHFAPAGRAGPSVMEAQVGACLDSPVMKVVLEALDSLVMILNDQRQFLAGNRALLEALAKDHPESCHGLRPGELFQCVHVVEGPDGCGTSKSCAQCGAVISILAAQASEAPAVGECTLSRSHEGLWSACDYSVKATPIEVGGHRLLVFVLRDIASEKRREMLERVFLHDLMNNLHGLNGWIELLQQGQDARWTAGKILDVAERLTHDVHTQRLLLEAENGVLRPRPSRQSPEALLEAVVAQVSRHPASAGHLFTVAPSTREDVLRVDGALLGRVLCNMALNAVEASQPGQPIRLEYAQDDGRPAFHVHNAGWIPDPVALRIFQRSFSTKGKAGRGLGTYSMKLLGENILGGKVSFETSQAQGTRFTIRLPASNLT